MTGLVNLSAALIVALLTATLVFGTKESARLNNIIVARAPRPFRVPGVPLVPLLGIASCLVPMAGLPLVTWLRLLVWLAIGLTIYGSYGQRHSVLRNRDQAK